MFRDRFNLKEASAERIVDKFDVSYYTAEIEEIRNRIYNIRIGKPEYYGKDSRYYPSNVLTGKDAERRIKELEKRKKRLEKEMSKYSRVASLARHTEFELDRMAKRDALLGLFDSAVYSVEHHYNTKTKQFEDSPVLEKNEKKLIKARRKDHGKLRKERKTVDRKMYHTLKRYSKKMRLLINGNGMSINTVIKESKFSLESLFWNLYLDKSNEYEKKGYLLGVDTKILDRVKEIMKEDYNFSYNSFCVGNSYSKYMDLKHIHKMPSYAKINGMIYKFIGKYEEILKRGKELHALELIINAFSKTEIKNSESYISLVEVCKREEQNIIKMVQEVDKEYEKANLPELIENHKKLEELYNKYLRAMRAHFDSKDANYSWSEYTREADEYRAEMYAIIRKYPELNRPEYKIEIDPKKKDVTQQVPSNDALESSKLSVKEGIVDSSKPVLSGVRSDVVEVIKDERDFRKLVTTYEGEIPKRVVADFGSEQEEKSEEELRQPIEVPDYLSGNITVYYQQYMKEKLLKTELGKLKFSEFLEHVRPDLKELIEIERKREQRVETIYRKYLKYRISLKDKENAMSFKEFAKFNYGLENYEIPEEYTEPARKR